jgi:hypothetical protein
MLKKWRFWIASKPPQNKVSITEEDELETTYVFQSKQTTADSPTKALGNNAQGSSRSLCASPHDECTGSRSRSLDR